MLGKIICFAIGVWCGIALMSIFVLAGKADETEETVRRKKSQIQFKN